MAGRFTSLIARSAKAQQDPSVISLALGVTVARLHGKVKGLTNDRDHTDVCPVAREVTVARLAIVMNSYEHGTR